MQMQQRGNCCGIRPRVRLARRRAAGLASDGAVGGDAGFSRGRTRLRELVRDRTAGARIHFVGRLAIEGRKRDYGIMLVDIKGDQALIHVPGRRAGLRSV